MSDTDHTLTIQQNTMLDAAVRSILRQMHQSAAVEQDKSILNTIKD